MSRPLSFPRAVPAALAVLGLLATASAASAQAGSGSVTSFTATFSTTHRSVSSGLKVRVTGGPPAAGTQLAPAVRQVVTLPLGTRLRLGALPQCTASDADIAARGAEAACPARTRVGTGAADGLLGAMPVHFDIGVYAVRGALVLAAERGGQPLKQSFRGTASGRRLTFVVPTLNGTLAPTLFSFSLPARKGVLRTPATCPASGSWTTTTAFQGLTAVTGGMPVGAAQAATATTRCRRY